MNQMNHFFLHEGGSFFPENSFNPNAQSWYQSEESDDYFDDDPQSIMRRIEKNERRSPFTLVCTVKHEGSVTRSTRVDENVYFDVQAGELGILADNGEWYHEAFSKELVQDVKINKILPGKFSIIYGLLDRYNIEPFDTDIEWKDEYDDMTECQVLCDVFGFTEQAHTIEISRNFGSYYIEGTYAKRMNLSKLRSLFNSCLAKRELDHLPLLAQQLQNYSESDLIKDDEGNNVISFLHKKYGIDLSEYGMFLNGSVHKDHKNNELIEQLRVYELIGDGCIGSYSSLLCKGMVLNVKELHNLTSSLVCNANLAIAFLASGLSRYFYNDIPGSKSYISYGDMFETIVGMIVEKYQYEGLWSFLSRMNFGLYVTSDAKEGNPVLTAINTCSRGAIVYISDGQLVIRNHSSRLFVDVELQPAINVNSIDQDVPFYKSYAYLRNKATHYVPRKKPVGVKKRTTDNEHVSLSEYRSSQKNYDLNQFSNARSLEEVARNYDLSVSTKIQTDFTQRANYLHEYVQSFMGKRENPPEIGKVITRRYVSKRLTEDENNIPGLHNKIITLNRMVRSHFTVEYDLSAFMSDDPPGWVGELTVTTDGIAHVFSVLGARSKKILKGYLSLLALEVFE